MADGWMQKTDYFGTFLDTMSAKPSHLGALASKLGLPDVPSELSTVVSYNVADRVLAYLTERWKLGEREVDMISLVKALRQPLGVLLNSLEQMRQFGIIEGASSAANVRLTEQGVGVGMAALNVGLSPFQTAP